MLPRYGILQILVLILFCTGVSQSWGLVDEAQFRGTFKEEERLAGFSAHEKAAKDFDRQRESGVGDVKREREAWDRMMSKSRPAFEKEKVQAAAPLDESSVAYKADLRAKLRYVEQQEEIEKAYVRARNRAANQKSSRIHLKEEQELGLWPDPIRVSLQNRPIYTGKINSIGRSSGGGSGSSGSTSGGIEAAAPSIPSIPPPPTNPTDFYEPDIPPPPPPLDGSFEDSIPPPIFDEPEF